MQFLAADFFMFINICCLYSETAENETKKERHQPSLVAEKSVKKRFANKQKQKNGKTGKLVQHSLYSSESTKKYVILYLNN